MQFNFTKYSKVYYTISGLLVLATIVSLIAFGLKFGIEFAGGSSMDVQFQNARPSVDQISSSLSSLNLGTITVQPAGTSEAIIEFKGVDEATHQKVLAQLNSAYPVTEKSFQYIGPSVGDALRNQTEIAIVLALAAITLYIAFAFRKVARPVSSFKYGLTSLVALFHDILIPIGVFSVLGHFYNIEVTVPVVAALLTIMGFSVHDTIVIFDRIRENIFRRGMDNFEDTVNWSLNQTVGRSISTVVTVLLVLVIMYFFGGETLQSFTLAMIIGIVSGAYSSIFIASPLLVTWYKRGLKKTAK
jgi:preprotein translocase subunit SecF